MKEHEMIKAFADLELLEVKLVDGKYKILRQYDFEYWEEYNPITDHELTFKAIYDYDVFIDVSECMIEINGGNVLNKDSKNVCVFFTDFSDFSKCVIECILKSKGLWK